MKLVSRNGHSTVSQELIPSIKPAITLVEEDPETYVGDEAVLARLEEITKNIREGRYDEETKQAIYYYGECYVKDENEAPSEYIKDANIATKYFVTGWWVHELIDANSKEEKLTQEGIAHQNQ